MCSACHIRRVWAMPTKQILVKWFFYDYTVRHVQFINPVIIFIFMRKKNCYCLIGHTSCTFILNVKLNKKKVQIYFAYFILHALKWIFVYLFVPQSLVLYQSFLNRMFLTLIFGQKFLQNSQNYSYNFD